MFQMHSLRAKRQKIEEKGAQVIDQFIYNFFQHISRGGIMIYNFLSAFLNCNGSLLQIAAQLGI